MHSHKSFPPFPPSGQFMCHSSGHFICYQHAQIELLPNEPNSKNMDRDLRIAPVAQKSIHPSSTCFRIELDAFFVNR